MLGQIQGASLIETRAGLGSQGDFCSYLDSSGVSAGQPCLNALNLIFEMEIIKPAQRVIGRILQKNVFKTVALWRAESRHFVILVYSFLKDAGPKEYQKAEDGLRRVWVGGSSCTSHLVTAVVH